MSDGRRLPNPARSEPSLPAGVALFGYASTTVLVGVFGGAALSALLSGHGLGAVAPQDMPRTLLRLLHNPAHPAAVWPNEPRPGPGWLTWICIAAVCTLWCAGVMIVADELDRRWRRRSRAGLARRSDLNRIGLDRRSALGKSRNEFPNLARQCRRKGRR